MLLSFRELVFGVRNFSSALVTPLPSFWTTGAFIVALFRGFAVASEGNPSAPVTPVTHLSMHRCNIVRLCTVSDVNDYYLDLV